MFSGSVFVRCYSWVYFELFHCGCVAVRVKVTRVPMLTAEVLGSGVDE